MKYAHFDPDYLKKADNVMDDVYNVSTDTEVAQAPVASEASV